LLVAGAAHGGVAARQHLAVTESDYRLDAPGLQGLHAGLVTVSVRNTAAGQHGVLILRLKHPMTGDAEGRLNLSNEMPSTL